MGGVLRSLWRRPNLDHDVENPLRTSTAPEVDSSSLGTRSLPGPTDLEPPYELPESDSDMSGHDFIIQPSTPISLDRASRLPISSSDDSRRRRSALALPTLPCQYQPPQLCDLVYELRKVDWHQLGVQLRLPPDRLDKIEEDYKQSERRLYKVLEYWLDNEMNPSWDKICETLRRIGGFAKLICELKVKYCSLSELFCSSITCVRCNQRHLCKSDNCTVYTRLDCDVDCNILKAIENLQRDFRERVTHIRLSFKTAVSVATIKELLSQELPAGEVKGQVGLLLSNNFMTIRSSYSIDHLFIYLSNIQAWDFLHPQLLEYLVQELGDDDAKRSMEEYKSCLVQFRRTTKMRQLSGWFGRITESSTFQKIVLSLGSDWEEKTYEEFEELRVSLLRQEVFFQSSLHLCGVLTGSLFVALVIPKSVDVAVMRQMLGEYQLLKFLMDSGVLSIYAEQVCLIQDAPTALSHHDTGSKTPQASLATDIITTASVVTVSKGRCKSLPLFGSKDLPPPSQTGHNTSGSLPDISQHKLDYFKSTKHFISYHSEDSDRTLVSEECGPLSGSTMLLFPTQYRSDSDIPESYNKSPEFPYSIQESSSPTSS